MNLSSIHLKRMNYATLFCIMCSCISYNCVTGLSCLDRQGKPVDRWVAFKYPAGVSYAYWDSNTGSIVPQQDSLNDTTEGALALTMNQLWSDGGIGYALYNDEIPSTETYNFTVGHSKGVWMWDTRGSQGGESVFIQHSVPKFPTGPAGAPFGYQGLPPNAWDYGQHLGCLSMSFADLESIVASYNHVLPQIYESRGSFPSLDVLLNGGYNGDPVCQHFKLISTAVIVFTKTAAWNQDLYNACIAPTFDQGFAVESWLRGDSPLGPSCETNTVVDVQSVLMGGAAGDAYNSYDDHSKWAISTGSEEQGYVCMSDINRMESQFARNGGAVCFQDAGLWTALNSAIQSTDSDC